MEHLNWRVQLLYVPAGSRPIVARNHLNRSLGDAVQDLQKIRIQPRKVCATVFVDHAIHTAIRSRRHKLDVTDKDCVYRLNDLDCEPGTDYVLGVCHVSGRAFAISKERFCKYTVFET